MATDVTVTTALPLRGRDEAVMGVAAQFKPHLLRIVAGVPTPTFGRPFARHRFAVRRKRALARLSEAADVARTIIGPEARIETVLVRGSLSDHLAAGMDGASVLVVGGTGPRGEPTRRTLMQDGRVVVSVGSEKGTVTP
jgi:hypothetical protein